MKVTGRYSTMFLDEYKEVDSNLLRDLVSMADSLNELKVFLYSSKIYDAIHLIEKYESDCAVYRSEAKEYADEYVKTKEKLNALRKEKQSDG